MLNLFIFIYISSSVKLDPNLIPTIAEKTNHSLEGSRGKKIFSLFMKGHKECY